jgi:putative ABC transport system permease protein
VGVLTGGGYGGTNLSQVKADLDQRDDVASYDLLGFLNGTLRGQSIAVLVANSAARPVPLPIVAGRAPTKPGEVAIGTVTAARLGLDVGDVATFETSEGPTKLRVVGTTVLPAVGPLFADRAGLGLGAFSLAPPEAMKGDFVTFIGVHLKPHADAHAVVANMGSRFNAWDATATVPNSYAGPIRPSEIVDASEMQRGPMILAGLLAIALLGALVLSVTATVNARRRDFAIYRAVGFTRGQVASSVCWLALTSVAVWLVIGIPSGLLVGRFTWRRFASDLGVGLDVTTPRFFVAAVAVVALVVAVLAAARPARRAGRIPPAEALHTQ